MKKIISSDSDDSSEDESRNSLNFKFPVIVDIF